MKISSTDCGREHYIGRMAAAMTMTAVCLVLLSAGPVWAQNGGAGGTPGNAQNNPSQRPMQRIEGGAIFVDPSGQVHHLSDPSENPQLQQLIEQTMTGQRFRDYYGPNDASIFAEGSINPVVDNPLSLIANPNDLLSKFDWRARYSERMANQGSRENGPRVFVYPFQDLSSDGVGPHYTIGLTYSWIAALAARTNAVLMNIDPAEQWGYPDPTIPVNSITRESCLDRMRKEPGAQGADYILTGFYESDAGAASYKLSVGLLEMKPDGKYIELAILAPEMNPSGENGSDHSIGVLDSLVRPSFSKVVEKLTAHGFQLYGNMGFEQPIDMAREIGEIMQMLAVNDSHATMEAIDRSLQLAILAPDRTEPLQAAAYGYAQLGYIKFGYLYDTVYYKDYALRSWGLALLARSMDDKPVMSRLLWLNGLKAFNMSDSGLADSMFNEQEGIEAGDTVPMYRWLASLYQYKYPDNIEEKLPEWTPFQLHRDWIEKRAIDQSPLIPRIVELARKSQLQDFHVEAGLRKSWDSEYDQRRQQTHSFADYIAASASTGYWTLAELAAYQLVLLDDPGRRNTLARKVAELAGLPVDSIASMAEQRDFYALRHALWTKWQDGPNFRERYLKFSFILTSLSEESNRLFEETRSARPTSKMTGLEFTPHEQMRFARQRDGLGPTLGMQFEGNMFGSFESVCSLSLPYLTVRPDNAQVMLSQAIFADKWSAQPGGAMLLSNSSAKGYKVFPLAKEFMELIVHDLLLKEQRTEAMICMQNMIRQNRNDSEIWSIAGENYVKVGARGLAVEAYEQAMKNSPTDYGLWRDAAWNLCELGRAEHPGVREYFVYTLQGRKMEFYEDYLNYLTYWAEDYDGARSIAKSLSRSLPMEGGIWMARIEANAGEKEKAARTLKAINPPRLQGLSLAVHYATKSIIAADLLDDMDLAKEYVDKAAAIDSWQWYVIKAMGLYAQKTGSWDEALWHYRRMAERYGVDGTAVMGQFMCLQGLQRDAEARQLLESHVLKPAYTEDGAAYATELMKIYAKDGDSEKAETLMNWVLNDCKKSRKGMEELLAEYRKLNAVRGKELLDRLDAIMGGPTLEELTGVGAKSTQ